MTKIVVAGDVHVGIYNNFAKPIKDDNINDMTKESLDGLQQVLDYAGDNDVDYVVINGDLFDHRGTLDVRIMNKVSKMFKDFLDSSTHDCTIYLLAGNHDQIDNSPIPENSLAFLEGLNDSSSNTSIKVIDRPDTEMPSHVGVDSNVDFYFLPYSEDVKMLKDWLNEAVKGLDPRQTNFLFAHVGVEGATDGGLYTHRLGGAFAVGDLHPSDFDYVLLSHYHNRQQMGKAKNMWYIGSTTQKSFSDEGQDKGFDVFDVTSDPKSEKAKVKHEFHKVSYTPFITVDMKTTKLDDKGLHDLMKKAHVRIKTYNKEQAKELQTMASDGDMNISISLKEEQKGKESRLGLDATSSEAQIVSKYTKAYYPNVRKKALEVLRKAQEEN